MAWNEYLNEFTFILNVTVARDSDGTGCLLVTWEVIEKESSGVERICGCLYVPFEEIFCFTRNEKNAVFVGFLRQRKWCKVLAQR